MGSSTSRAVETARETAVQSSRETPPSLSTYRRSVWRPPPPPSSTSTSSRPSCAASGAATWRTFSRISSFRPIAKAPALRPPEKKKWVTPDPLSVQSFRKCGAGINTPTRDSQTGAEATVFLAAAVQMRSGNDRAANEARALALLGEAADRGARLIGLPEMWEHIGPAREKHAFAGPLEGAQLARLREFCAKRQVWCLAGSIAELAPEERGSASRRAEAEGRSIGNGRVYNTSALIAPGGEIVAAYRKLHLFDVD